MILFAADTTSTRPSRARTSPRPFAENYLSPAHNGNMTKDQGTGFLFPFPWSLVPAFRVPPTPLYLFLPAPKSLQSFLTDIKSITSGALSHTDVHRKQRVWCKETSFLAQNTPIFELFSRFLQQKCGFHLAKITLLAQQPHRAAELPRTQARRETSSRTPQIPSAAQPGSSRWQPDKKPSPRPTRRARHPSQADR